MAGRRVASEGKERSAQALRSSGQAGMPVPRAKKAAASRRTPGRRHPDRAGMNAVAATEETEDAALKGRRYISDVKSPLQKGGHDVPGAARNLRYRALRIRKSRSLTATRVRDDNREAKAPVKRGTVRRREAVVCGRGPSGSRRGRRLRE